MTKVVNLGKIVFLDVTGDYSVLRLGTTGVSLISTYLLEKNIIYQFVFYFHFMF